MPPHSSFSFVKADTGKNTPRVRVKLGYPFSFPRKHTNPRLYQTGWCDDAWGDGGEGYYFCSIFFNRKIVFFCFFLLLFYFFHFTVIFLLFLLLSLLIPPFLPLLPLSGSFSGASFLRNSTLHDLPLLGILHPLGLLHRQLGRPLLRVIPLNALHVPQLLLVEPQRQPPARQPGRLRHLPQLSVRLREPLRRQPHARAQGGEAQLTGKVVADEVERQVLQRRPRLAIHEVVQLFEGGVGGWGAEAELDGPARVERRIDRDAEGETGSLDGRRRRRRRRRLCRRTRVLHQLLQRDKGGRCLAEGKRQLAASSAAALLLLAAAASSLRNLNLRRLHRRHLDAAHGRKRPAREALESALLRRAVLGDALHGQRPVLDVQTQPAPARRVVDHNRFLLGLLTLLLLLLLLFPLLAFLTLLVF
eukprot:Rhum_TRINITY_DN13767_c6_g1::Rhum_TRINITY_DN13767_c6_g1_i1::g.64129::m.64129